MTVERFLCGCNIFFLAFLALLLVPVWVLVVLGCLGWLVAASYAGTG